MGFNGGATRTGRGDPRPDPTYLALIRKFPLRPIRSDEELGRATAVIHALVDRPDLDLAEADYLDVLGDLVLKYETEHHPIPPASDGDMLRFLMEARDLTQTEVAAGAAMPQSVVSEVLAGKRRLSRDAIGRLASFFHVSPAVFPFEGRPAVRS